MHDNTTRAGVFGRSVRGHTVLTISGELDIATTAVLRDRIAAVLEDRAIPVIIDLSRVSFCDASGLRMLVAVRRRADAYGCTVALAAPRPNVRKLLRITGLDQVFPIYSTLAQAVSGRVDACGPAVA
ncbi:STAS domain-containing protein [Actinoallomurus sp. CA-142502]|uniref:STAS domain-containing protein n=1 Tax=Actinoallomurus sp. CA-142502 TaxID=3239885 RepID=UPI003D94C942